MRSDAAVARLPAIAMRFHVVTQLRGRVALAIVLLACACLIAPMMVGTPTAHAAVDHVYAISSFNGGTTYGAGGNTYCVVDSGANSIYMSGNPSGGRYVYTFGWDCVWMLRPWRPDPSTGVAPGLPAVERSTQQVVNVAVPNHATTAAASQAHAIFIIGPNPSYAVCTWGLQVTSARNCVGNYPNGTDYAYIQILQDFSASESFSNWRYWFSGVSVTVRDLYGPSVSLGGLNCSSPGQGGWCNGDISINFSSWDNYSDSGVGFGEQPTYASIDGTIAQGWGADSNPAGTSGWIGAGDGGHSYTISRAGIGWPTASATAYANIDKNPPSAPTIGGCNTSGWSNSACQPVAGGSSDGTGSGVAGYQYRYRYSADNTGWGAFSGWSASQPSFSAEGYYQLEARACDVSGLCSAATSATVRNDFTPPTNPPNLTSDNIAQVPASLAWDPSQDQPALSGVAGYFIYRDGVKVNTVPTSSRAWQDTTPDAPDGNYHYRITAIDNAGNESSGSLIDVVYDTTPPSTPTPTSVTGEYACDASGQSLKVEAGVSTDALSPPVTYLHKVRELPASGDPEDWSEIPLETGNPVEISQTGHWQVLFWVRDAVGNQTTDPVMQDVKVDCAKPDSPTVTGGSLNWQSRASVTITASGATANGPTPIDHYIYRWTTTAANGPFNGWSESAVATPVDGENAANHVFTLEGNTVVQMAAVSGAGVQSDWAPLQLNFALDGTGSSDAEATVRLDRIPPSFTVNNQDWTNAPEVDLRVSNSYDSNSGISGYQMSWRTSDGPSVIYGDDDGWQLPETFGPESEAAAHRTFSTEGIHEVRFTVCDNVTDDPPESPTNCETKTAVAKIDHTKPTVPSYLDGITTGWIRGRDHTVSAGGSTDAYSGVAGYQYQVSDRGPNDSDFTEPPRFGSQAVLQPGIWWVRFRAYDSAGNIGDWSQPPAEPIRLAFGSSYMAYSWADNSEDALCNLPTTSERARTDCPSGGYDWNTHRSSRLSEPATTTGQ